ncbi:hypothetical protein P8452_49077 [Trifolium repens]|nr:hypothetical protein P8452_49077 [Trifolium repens]
MKLICIFIPLLIMITQIIMVSCKIRNHVPAVIVFGDSSVDSGNNNKIATLLKSNFKPYGRDFEGGRPTGRFCNGRVPPDFIAEAFGVKKNIPAYLDPAYTIDDFVTGVCFASAGTGYDNATSNVLNVIPLWKEVEYFKEYQEKLRAHVDIAENFVRKIYSLGARKLSITGLIPMGCLPLERATNILGDHDCNEKYNNVAKQFNVKLENMISKISKELPQLKALSANPYHIFNDIITRPSFYGFEEAEKACCSTGTFEMSYLCSDKNPFTCKDANKYVFWDAFHPTEKTNRIASNHLIPKLLAAFR